MDYLAFISSLLGLIYVVSWSASFYPQALLNLVRKSTRGLTISFPVLNLLGFAAYSIYTGVFCFSPVVRQQYAARHPLSPIPSVSSWDFAFAVHGWVIIAITLSQFWTSLWGWQDETELESEEGGESAKAKAEERKMGGWVWAVLASGLLAVAAVGVWVLVFQKNHGREASEWAYIDIIYAFSNLKLYLTFFKYLPQAIYNARRRSTEGWSINQVLLDLAGGIASISQLFVDSYRFTRRESIFELHALSSKPSAGWTDGVDGNIAKFWLGNVSMFFDVIFMIQHYVLYKAPARDISGSQMGGNATDTEFDGERQPLLSNSENA